MATSGGQTLGVTISANMDPSGILGAVRQMQGAFNGLKLPANLTGDILKDFNKLQESLKKFDSIAKQDHFSKTDLKNLEKLQKEIDSTFGSLKSSFNDLSGQKFYLDADYTKIKEAKTAVDELKADIQSKLSEIKIDFSSAKGGTASLGLDEMISGMERGVKSSKVLSAAMGEVKQSLQAGNFSAAADQISQIITKSNDLKGAGTGLLNTFKQWGLIDFSTPANELVKTKKGAELLATALSKIVPEISKDNEAVQKLAEKLQEAVKQKEGLEKTGAENFAKDMSTGAQSAEQLGTAFKTAGQSSREMAQGISQAAEQVKQLQQSTQYFFSLRNMLNLFKRGVREAVDTVKELDKAMTETAVVVPEWDVGDMWAKLPEYTENANALGASVLDMYKASTLYYQQGLRGNEVLEIASETMKMARIGGLEAADATDKMTAALRGFNMEINETSAQHINDVYSNLAANTASNTQELGTAMQRTASIAASAGMSFEGTAAFLAQAIETTREPAENLGTAMKTIVARFTELKKNPLEIAEVDGEEVSYNKVDAALQSIGVSLKDTNGQFRDLDDVFLDISQRWDSLTQTQQRYIATTAAGSRQQSRFIAMMSNYDRTVQLMDYANNANGASTEQFNKTLDSLEAKLTKFKNAWKEFLMGIMNDSWTKGLVDAGTKVLSIVNKLIDLLSGGGKFKGIKSGLSLLTAFTGLKMAGRGANMLIGGLGGLVDPNSSAKIGMRNGALGGQAAKISNPIVKAIYSLIPHIDKAVTGGLQYKGYGDFKGAKQDLNNQLNSLSIQKKGGLIGLNNTNKYSLSGINDIFSKNGINEAQQKALYASYPGLKHNMTNTLAKVLQESGADPQTTKGLIAGFKSGDFTSAQVLEKAGLVRSFSNEMQTISEKSGKEAANAFRRSETKELVSNGLDKKIVQQGKELGYTGKDLTNYVRGEIDKRVNTKTYATNDKTQAILDAQHELSKTEQIANSVGKLGGALSSAGMSLQMFGAQLSTTNPILGEMITKMGGLLSTAGALPNAISSIIAGGPAIWTLTAAVTALGAAWMYFSNQQKKIKDAAEKVTKNFEETNKKAQDNITNLKSYRTELTTLSKGVDENGNNVNLNDDDYARYLEIVDDIAAINPEIVKGYNAQGHAIINNNEALEETLKKQQEIRDEATKKYTNKDSLQKLVDARNIDKNYKKSAYITTEGSQWRSNGEISGLSGTRVKAAPMTAAVKDTISELQKQDWFDEDQFKDQFGIDVNNLTDDMIRKFVNSQDTISAAMTNWADAAGAEYSKTVSKSFDSLEEETNAFNETIEPIFQNLATSFSESSLYDSIPEEFRQFAMTGLKEIASQDWDASKMIDESKKLATRMANLTDESSEYAEIMRGVEEAQQNFASSLDETQYKADVQPAIDDLNRLKEAALKEGGAYGAALSEYLENQIQHIARFTEEGSISLTEALNTATDEIAAAESALENFNEATKTDYSTAAEGMKSIFDKSLETFKDSYGTEIQKHFEGKGDKTAWAAADALLDQESIDKIYKKAGGDGYKAAEMAAKKIQSLEPMLREGQEGFEAFEDRVLASADALGKIDGVTWDSDGLLTNIPDDKWHAVAEALDISDDMLTSMLNKGRQFADINFTNWDDVRKSLATSDFTIKGTTAAEGAQKLYVKESTFEQSLAEANISRNQYKQYKDTAKKEQNIDFLKPAEEYKKGSEVLAKKFNDMGVKTLPDLVNTLVKTGDFNKEEIKAYADKLNLLDTETGYNEIYDSVLSALDNPEIAKQTNIQQGISDKLSLLLGNDIQAGKEAEQDLNDYINSNAIQNFAKGKNEAGETISAGEYEATKQNIEEASRAAREHAEEQRRLADLTYGQEKANHLKLAESLEKDAEKLDELGKSGVNAFKDIAEQQKINAREKQALKSKNKNRKINPPKQYQEPSNVRTLQKEAKIEKTVEPIKTGAETGKKIIETVIKTKEDSSVAKTDKKYDKWGKPIETSIDVSVGGKEQIEAVDSGIKEVAQIAKKSLKLSIDADSQPVEEAQDSVTDAQKEASNGADFKVTADYSQAVAAGNYLGAAAKTYNATFRASSSGLSTVSSVLSSILGKIRSINTTPVSPKGGQGAFGHNNQIHYHSSPTFGSAAKGRHGTVGPKDKGGLTLTGEKGFEIAWIPSENSSMILGVGGPQMLNLPSDAVIYTHEQSKKILSRKGIPAGSHANEDAKPGSTKRKYDPASQQDSSSDSNSNSKPKPKPKPKPTGDKEQKATKQISLWWDKISRQVEGAKKKSDNLSKTITKTLNDIRASVDLVNKTNGKNAKFIKTQQKNIKLNSTIEKKSTSKLKKLDTSKKGSKKKITYKDSKGKEHKSKVSLSDYISYDATTDSYYVNSKVNSKKAGSKAKRKAIKEKAYELIDKYQGRRDDAREAITESQDQLSEYRKQIDDTFFGWENELTKVYKITSEIEKTEALIGKSRSKYSLAQTQLEYLDLSRGATGAKDLKSILSTMKAANKEAIQGYGDEIKQKSALVNSLKEEVSKYDELDDAHTVMYQTIDGTVKQTTELARYAMIKGIANNGSGTGWDELSENDKKIYTRGRAFEAGYISKDSQGNWTLNETAIANAIAAGQMTGDFGERLKTLFDNLKQNTIDTINAESEIYSLQQEQLEAEQEYNDQMKQIADQLYGWKNTLTKILELTTKIEQVEKRTSLLKQGEEYYTAKRKAGYGVNSTTMLQTYTGQLASSITAIQKRQELIEKQREGLKDYISGNDISKELARASAEFAKDPNNDVLKAQLQNLKEEAQYRKDAQKYITTIANGDGTFTIEFDSEQLELDKIANGGSVGTEYYNKIEEYAQELISKNNELAENLAASVSSVTELYTMLSDLRQTYADSAKELREAYNTQQQKVIDNLKTLYTAVDNAFKDLISQVKQSIQQRRQAEDNAKTEKDINKKQQRLAALRANTAGGNQVAIAQLEKEIADAQQSYGRTLEDQMLNTLSQQGDEAAKQRQEQINLLQAQRDIAYKTGLDAAQINQWLHNPMLHENEIKAALRGTDAWASLTEAERKVYDDALNAKFMGYEELPSKISLTEQAISLVGNNLSVLDKTEQIISQATLSAISTATETIQKGLVDGLKAMGTDLGIDLTNTKQTITDINNETKNAISKLQEQINAVNKQIADVQAAQAAEAARKAAEEAAQKAAEEARAAAAAERAAYEDEQRRRAEAEAQAQKRNTARTNYSNFLSSRGSSLKTSDPYWGKIGKDGIAQAIKLGGAAGKNSEWEVLYDLANYGGKGAPLYGEWEKILDAYISYKGSEKAAYNTIHDAYKQGATSTNKREEKWNKAFKNKKYKFKTGGLADYTGLAWLDGTPSKPELVLNAKDTQNFIALRDVLSKALGSTNSVSNEYGGDILYEININVDKIEKDYDVDRVVEKVKKEIVKGAGYRNVTQVRNFR